MYQVRLTILRNSDGDVYQTEPVMTLSDDSYTLLSTHARADIGPTENPGEGQAWFTNLAVSLLTAIGAGQISLTAITTEIIDFLRVASLVQLNKIGLKTELAP